ncbi:DUF6671 family protein [Jannaschia sp. R86511]|uniref:DUF6671 family protein n=1 Tax=Jannaschia sp. R86511 TaxID=3093853 RepID=UPI0036D32725
MSARRHVPLHPYLGRRIAFGTRHGKEHQVAGPFAEILGATVLTPPDLDTDQFGTFTGDVGRVGTPAQTARAKAELGATALGVPTALGSEASYGDPTGLLVPVHEELLMFVDLDRDIEVIEGQRSITTLPAPRRAQTLADLEPHLHRFGFPAQALVVRPAGHPTDRNRPPDPAHLSKGITERTELDRALRRAASASPDGHAMVEADLRAHHNPTRRTVLRALGDRLALRLNTSCPACASPGYGRTATVPGLPCRTCHRPTDLARADTHTCPACPHTHTEPRPATTANPVSCPTCNP